MKESIPKTAVTSTSPVPAVNGDVVAVPTNRLRFVDVGQHAISDGGSPTKVLILTRWALILETQSFEEYIMAKRHMRTTLTEFSSGRWMQDASS